MFVDPYHDFLRHGHTYVHFDAPVNEPTGQQKSAIFLLTYPVKITLMFILNAFPLLVELCHPVKTTLIGGWPCLRISVSFGDAEHRQPMKLK